MKKTILLLAVIVYFGSELLQKWEDMVFAAEESLKKINIEVLLRGSVAEFLIRAGEQTQNDATILKGKRELFCSNPSDFNLGLLIEEADRQKLKAEELERALQFLDQKKSSDNRVRVKILLMMGRLDDISKIIKEAKLIGWKYDSTGIGVFFSGV